MIRSFSPSAFSPSASTGRALGLVAFALLLAVAVPAPVSAQVAPAPDPAAETQAPSKQELDKAIKLLEDDKVRGKMLEQLQTLSKAADATGEAERTTLGTRVVKAIREKWADLGTLKDNFREAAAVWPAVTRWLERQVESPAVRERWVRFVEELAMVLASGLAASLVVGWALGRPRRAINAKTPKTGLGKLPWLTARSVVELLPVVALGVTAYAVLASTDPAERVRLAALPIINATIAVRLLALAGNFVLSPQGPGLRLVRIDDPAAKRASRHLRAIGLVGFYGWFLAEAVFVLGLPGPAYILAIKVVGAAVAAMLLHRIFTYRRAVARLIRGEGVVSGDGIDSLPLDDSAHGRRVAKLGLIRRRVAEVWHLVAAAYVAVACGVWLLEINGGFTFLARATLISVVVSAFAQAVIGSIGRGMSRPLRLSDRVNREFPGLSRLIDGYRPWLRQGLSALVGAGALVLVLEAWGAGSLAWLAGDVGQRVVGSVISISIAVVASVTAWVVVSMTIEHALLPDGPEGRHVEKSARVRTLLPLARNAFLVLLVVFVGLFSLAEIGVNIAPLLAGAGVIGLAIGFGSQTLVKDVITGLFILIEDTISVGDVVDVGDGHSGVVEAISIRTIRLRDVSGTVHTVPYSSVTSIRNMTKDFSHAVFEVEVAYREDVDNVIDVLKEVATGLETEPDFERDILEPLEIMGLDQLAASGVVIKARFKTKPGRQWAVTREFNRRYKRRFDELGISIPFPHRQMVWDPSPAFLAAIRAQMEERTQRRADSGPGGAGPGGAGPSGAAPSLPSPSGTPT